MKALGSIALAFVTLSTLSACNYDLLTRRQFQAKDRAASAPTVSFADVRAKVFETSCQQCHATTFPHLENYRDVKFALASIENAVLVKRSMPRNSTLTNEQLDILRTWIDLGAPELANEPSGPKPEPTPEPTAAKTWDDLRQGLVNTSCASCHYAGNPDGRIDLTDEHVFKESIGTIMYVSLVEKESPMPPLTSVPLTTEQKRLLTEWVISNLPEDGK